MIFIPGFRTRKPLKMVIASLYYLICLSMVTTGIGYMLGSLSMPFVFFYAVSLFKDKDKRFTLPLIVSIVVFCIAIGVTPSKNSNIVNRDKQVELGKTATITPVPSAAAQSESNDNKGLGVNTSSPIPSPIPTKIPATPSPEPSPTPQKDETYNITVKLESVNMVYNNHVGNEWVYGASIDDKELRPGSSITLSCKDSDKIVIQAYAEEQDKIPDQGGNSLEIDVGSLEKGKESTCSTEVVVSENRGRYSGNTAGWKFTFSVVKK